MTLKATITVIPLKPNSASINQRYLNCLDTTLLRNNGRLVPPDPAPAASDSAPGVSSPSTPDDPGLAEPWRWMVDLSNLAAEWPIRKSLKDTHQHLLYRNKIRWIKLKYNTITRWGEIRWTVWNGGDLQCLKVEQIHDYLFIDTYKSNKVKIGTN